MYCQTDDDSQLMPLEFPPVGGKQCKRRKRRFKRDRLRREGSKCQVRATGDYSAEKKRG